MKEKSKRQLPVAGDEGEQEQAGGSLALSYSTASWRVDLPPMSQQGFCCLCT